MKGDIVLVLFPFSDLTSNKVRPAIIISNSIVNKTTDVILAQITSKLHNDSFSFVIEDKYISRSLEGQSEIRCNKLFTAEKSIIKKKISSLISDKHSELLEKITSLLK